MFAAAPSSAAPLWTHPCRAITCIPRVFGLRAILSGALLCVEVGLSNVSVSMVQMPTSLPPRSKMPHSELCGRTKRVTCCSSTLICVHGTYSLSTVAHVCLVSSCTARPKSPQPPHQSIYSSETYPPSPSSSLLLSLLKVSIQQSFPTRFHFQGSSSTN